MFDEAYIMTWWRKGVTWEVESLNEFRVASGKAFS